MYASYSSRAWAATPSTSHSSGARCGRAPGRRPPRSRSTARPSTATSPGCRAPRCTQPAISRFRAATAPEHPFPAPLDDVRAALGWAIDHADAIGARRVGAVGDSSGGNLVAAAARHVDGLALQALIYPALDLARPLVPVDDPDGIVKPGGGDAVREAYLSGADPTDPDVSPLLAADLAGLPRTVVCVAEYDALGPQGHEYAERLAAAGVPVTVVDAHGLDHAFFAWGTFAKRPAEAIAEFGEAVRSALAA